MKIHRQASKVLASALALVCIGQMSRALEYTPGKGLKWNYAEDKALTAAMDMRVRLSHWDRNVVWPEVPPFDGPAVEYLRVRTRLKLGLDLWDNAKLSARFTNRMHNMSSTWVNPNDNGSGTWQYPDEVILDQLALTMTDLGVEGLTATLGRQDFILGNGMVMLEGTPYDQGRTIYFDGLSIRYKNECDALALFAFYNQAQDEFVVVGDEDRPLRRGDIFTTGIDWTHRLSDTVNTELYYIFANVHDTDITAAMREHEVDSNAQLNFVGLRVFGDITEKVSYSAELCRMFGDYDENPSLISSSDGSADADGMMADVRLTVKEPEWKLKPSLMFEYTYFSGDDPDTGDYEGWDGLFAEYPIFTEELLPIMNNGAWTNLHQFRLEGKAQLHKQVSCKASWAHLRADESGVAMTSGGGHGDHFGDLFSAFLDFKVNDYVTISLQAAFFESGDYWDTNADSEWLRMQTMITF